jgi:cellulose synthase/poly-beta-1,6-N-acetylglucosamine synthase-like glycosyltransferase
MFNLSVVEILFWVTALFLLYTLYGYPLLLSLISFFKKEEIYAGVPDEKPLVSFIVAAYNEEKNISAKVQNLQLIEYDQGKIEFVIGSDASTDNTDKILSRASAMDDRLKYFRLQNRSGKIAVLQKAVESASGSILVFTDCSVRTEYDIMPKILSCFENPEVGMVSSRDVWIDGTDSSAEPQKQYINYEMRIRRMESRLNSLISASGSFFAMRKELFRFPSSHVADDFALPLTVYRQGYRVIHRDDLIGYVPMVKSSRIEISRRTRIIRDGILTVAANFTLLNPFRYPIFSWQLWSHKAFKWLFPFTMLFNMGLAVLLWNQGITYRVVVFAYGMFFILGVLGFLLKSRSLICKPFRTANFLLISMAAVVTAWYQVITAKRASTWEPTHR